MRTIDRFNYHPWGGATREHGTRLCAFANHIGGRAFTDGPTLLHICGDLDDAAAAYAAHRNAPPLRRHPTLGAIVRTHVDALLSELGLPPTTDREIDEARMEFVDAEVRQMYAEGRAPRRPEDEEWAALTGTTPDDPPELHIVRYDRQTGAKTCELLQPPRGAQ